jgi:pantoate--beta-alanine ligase
MEIIRTISWMKETIEQARAENHVIGFIPTMGALHEGHLSLIRQARERCSRVYASIFLNPTQFGPNEDLSKYPRTFAVDAEKLAAAGVDVLFAPDSKEIYPSGFRTYVNVEGLSEKLEGKSRPGHFRGVATVVLKLFEVVQPQFAFFGRKDAQQVRILQQMTSDLNLNVEIVVCQIVREPDGLALSSRNTYLSPEERGAATTLYRALDEARREVAAGTRDAFQIQSTIHKVLSGEPRARLDYVEIVDRETFEPVARLGARSVYVLLAVYVGKTRLIDNLLIEPAPNQNKLLGSL